MRVRGLVGGVVLTLITAAAAMGGAGAVVASGATTCPGTYGTSSGKQAVTFSKIAYRNTTCTVADLVLGQYVGSPSSPHYGFTCHSVKTKVKNVELTYCGVGTARISATETTKTA